MKPEHVELIKKIFRCKHEKTDLDEVFYAVSHKNIGIGEQYFLFDAADVDMLIAAIKEPHIKRASAQNKLIESLRNGNGK